MKFLFLSLLLLVFTLSCKKKELYFEINANIIDGASNNIVKELNYTLIQISADGNSEKTLVDKKVITENGNFKIRFKRESSIKYLVKIKVENYIEFEEEINFSEFSTEVPLFKRYQIYPKSWVKFNVKNQFPYNENDVYTLFFDHKIDNCEACCQYEKMMFSGMKDTSYLCLYPGGQKFDFSFIISIPLTQSSFSVTTIPLDTVEVNCFY